MGAITKEDLLRIIRSYNPEEVEIITKAYDYADALHSGQFRQSGDAYITHPLNVAYILAQMHADRDTVCAGLLHDTLEDTNATKDDIENLFNKDIANLVDGVTKLSKMNFSSKEDMHYANTRKIITGITEDVRIIIIKLADRLHNMRTLEYKSEFKQKENALETMDLFVPLAYYIGAYAIKNELEDLSFKYLRPKMYSRILELKLKFEEEGNACLQEMLFKIQSLLQDRNVPNEIKMRTKNIYGIYKKMGINKTRDVHDFDALRIHDLYALKVIVDSIDECYKALCLVHGEFHPLNGRFKDYISNPKTNMYRSLHTTVFGPEGRLVQTQIRTFEMDKIAEHGLTASWDIDKGEARKTMQNALKNQFQFFRAIENIDARYDDNREFVNQIKSELFSDRVYVYTLSGEVIELPKGYTVIDLISRSNLDIKDVLKVYINDEQVSFDYLFKNQDRIRIHTSQLLGHSFPIWEESTKKLFL